MGPVNLLKAKNRDELRQWLEQNHKTEKECWVVVKRGKPKENNTFWYIDAVEEAMCFGWIDSTTKNSIMVSLHKNWLPAEQEAYGLN